MSEQLNNNQRNEGNSAPTGWEKLADYSPQPVSEPILQTESAAVKPDDTKAEQAAKERALDAARSAASSNKGTGKAFLKGVAEAANPVKEPAAVRSGLGGRGLLQVLKDRKKRSQK
jgi:hypothetical protein